MTETTVQPPTGACLICESDQALMPGGIIPEHLDERFTEKDRPAKGAIQCHGAGFGPAQDDGRDAARRQGVAQAHALRGEIARKRADFLDSLARGWKIADVVDYHAGTLVVLETMAARSRQLGLTGDWWNTVRDALQVVTRRLLSTDPIELAMADRRRDGDLRWLRSVRSSMFEQADLGEQRKILSDLLFGI